MKLRDYLTKYKINRTAFANTCELPYSTLMYYASGMRCAKQKVAERIEKASDNVVTVMELRGKDDRLAIKQRPSNEYERSGQEVSRHQASSF